eukprot:Pompholyxophrys_punicea_v1_NODE_230_length_2663_cov_7.318896.p4 type:complete len:126 gc:universal NODE_230_length_2663_cov_7.318896:2179-1802(-)
MEHVDFVNNLQLLSSRKPLPKFLLLGDSITRRLSPYNTSDQVFFAGVGGDRVSGAAQRLEVYLRQANFHVVGLLIGTNNLNKGRVDGPRIATIVNQIVAMACSLQSRGVAVRVFSVLPRFDHRIE